MHDGCSGRGGGGKVEDDGSGNGGAGGNGFISSLVLGRDFDEFCIVYTV